MASSSPRLMSCILIVDSESPGWHKSMTKLLSCIQDRSYTVDAEMEYAHVSGKIASDVLLKMLAKVQKHIIPYRLDYGYGSQGYPSKELHSAEPVEARPAQAQVPAPNNDDKTKRPFCCTVM